MNVATKAQIFRPQNYFCLLQTAFFHSTAVLERKRGSSTSSSKSNGKKNKRSKKFLWEHQEKKLNVKKFLWENQEKVQRAVEQLRRKREEAAAKKAKEAEENLNNSTRESEFGYEDKDFDDLFRSIFCKSGGSNYRIYQEWDRRWWYHPCWYSGFCMTSWISTRRHYNNEEAVREEEEEEEEEEELLSDNEELYGYDQDPEPYEDDDDEESYSSSNYTNGWGSEEEYGYDPIEASHRETLGLSPWAPLKLEDVKHAYRTCALKWHPDLHNDSTKAEAEAKFKFCNVAYEYFIKKLQ